MVAQAMIGGAKNEEAKNGTRQHEYSENYRIDRYMKKPLGRYFALLTSPKILILGLLSAYLVYAYLSAHPPGYCEAQKRVIPEEEICVSLFDATIKAGNLQLGASEKTGRDYFMNHRNYCDIVKIEKNGFRLGGVFKDFFDERREIFLKYKMTVKAQKYHGASSSRDLEEWIFMTACGEILKVYSE